MKGKPKGTAKPEGVYPQADPTAPGGMSRANLRIELAEKHGMSMEESREMSWPDLIQAVIDGRLMREREAHVGGSPVAFERATAAEQIVDEGGLADLSDYSEEYIAQDHDAADMFPIDDEDEPDASQVRDFERDAASLEEEIDMFEDLDEYDEREDVGFDGPHPDDVRNMAMHADMAETIVIELDEGEVFDPEVMFKEMMEARYAELASNPPLFLGIPGIKDYVFDGHAGAGPSGSERWMHCTMSLTLAREFLETLSPNQQQQYAGANTAARQGTTAHAVGEAKVNHMLGRIDDAELEGTLIELAVEPDEGEAYDDEMDDYVQEWVDLIQSYANERGEKHVLIEARVEAAIPLADLHEGEVYIIRGSGDGIILPTEDHPTLVVGDLKYGEGIHVDAEANSQAMIYALGALGLLTDDEGNLIVDIEGVTLIIAQPRLGGIKTWDISLDDLFDWRDEVLSPALTKALYGKNEGATFNPSESACQFCPGRGACPALTEARYAQASEAFDAIIESEHTGDDIEPETLSNEKLGSMMSQIGGLVDLYKSLKEETQRRLHRGTSVPGYWLVNYTPPRKWKEGADESIRTSALPGLTKADRAKLFKSPVLLTPKQAILSLGEKGKAIESLYDTPDKRPVVSTGPGDRRTKWEGRPPEAMFDDESTPEDKVRAVEEMFPDESA